MNNKKVELLSPAGNLEKLKIAIKYGADAVYAGVSHFSLRIRAGKEFTFETFKEGIDYAHARGKKVYATINGFPFNSQIELLKKHIATMAELKPDAFIVAAPGVVKLCREIAPQIEKMTAMFTWPQLVTALIGTIVAMSVVPQIKRALKKSKN